MGRGVKEKEGRKGGRRINGEERKEEGMLVN